uniref:cupin domain-containing protein n=1 Tax=Flavobacterium sp. TaxID=239 RepID=UPI0040492F1D
MVKIAKFKGEFVMHRHEHEDELFYVIEGKLFIELNDKTLELNAGEFVIIPKGIEHKPYAPEEASVMLFEPTTTLNTGNVQNDLTLSDLDKI